MYKHQLVAHTKDLLHSIGIDPSGYTGHSFRAGAATTAGLMGFKDHEIKALGKWKSNAYQIYIRPDESQTAKLSSRLAGGNQH